MDSVKTRREKIDEAHSIVFRRTPLPAEEHYEHRPDGLYLVGRYGFTTEWELQHNKARCTWKDCTWQ